MNEDPRQRYRVEMDAALHRGDPFAWVRYQRAAELCERPPEEWELERSVGRPRPDAFARPPEPEDTAVVVFSITNETMLRASAVELRSIIDSYEREAVRMLESHGVPPDAIQRLGPIHSAERSQSEWRLWGRVA